ncbi:hypothetical protein FRX31_011344, partial [Thalictrum thalictroides]
VKDVSTEIAIRDEALVFEFKQISDVQAKVGTLEANVMELQSSRHAFIADLEAKSDEAIVVELTKRLDKAMAMMGIDMLAQDPCMLVTFLLDFLLICKHFNSII